MQLELLMSINLVKFTAITLTNQGEFFEEPPLIQIIKGGGSGATAEAFINLGVIQNIDLLTWRWWIYRSSRGYLY